MKSYTSTTITRFFISNFRNSILRKCLTVIVLSLIFLSIGKVTAQTIHIVPNPATGYASGGFVVYKNQLYTGFNKQTGSAIVGHLAKWTGSKLSIIPNPDNGGIALDAIVFNNKICIRYFTGSKYQLAQYNGSKLTLVPNPDNGLGYIISTAIPIIFNGKLYIPYVTVNNDTLMAAFNGTNLKIASTQDSLINYEGKPIIYNNKLYSAWMTQDRVSHLVEYDGSKFTIIANPANTPYSGIADFNVNGLSLYPDPIIYKSKLYYTYYSNTGTGFQLCSFNGTHLSLIINPTNTAVGVYVNNFIKYNDKLYLDYADATSNPFVFHFKLGQFDGTKLKIVAYADSSVIYPLGTFFTLYNNKIYFVNNPKSNILQLYNYDGTSIKPIPNPDGGSNQGTLPIVYNNKLYFGYIKTNGIAHLAFYNAQKTTIVPNPANDNGTGYLASSESLNYPFAFNDTLFFPYETASGGANLAYYYIDTTQATLQTFSVQSINTLKSTLFSISPNPAKDYINITSSATINDAQIIISDVNGKTLYSSKNSFTNGEQLKIPVAQFASETLFITITTSNGKEQFKVVKE